MTREQILQWLREQLESGELSEADRAAFTAALETQQQPDTAETLPAGEALTETFEPLIEKAVRRDGTVPIKVIGPGWGTSGYYGREVLERDVPRAFPAGTHMYWNHDTAVEAADRPEGDLNRLAAVTITEPRWQDSGANGPGMYTEAVVKSNYQPHLDELAEHIGVSIYALNGARQMGEADGKRGPIVTGIGPHARNSVDFVTRPGAGGGIVSLFESAGGPPLPDVSDDEALQEAANVGEWLESRLHLTLTRLADDMFGEGRLTRVERKSLSAAIGQALDAYNAAITANAPQLYEREPWADAPDDSGEQGDAPADESFTEAEMGQIEDLQAALTEANGRADAQQAELDRLREQALLRDARDFVNGRLTEAEELPAPTRARLLRELTANPPTGEDDRLDEAAFGERVKTAVEAAVNEVSAILEAGAANSGRITGMGSSSQTGQGEGGGELPTLEESNGRIEEALKELV